MTARAREHTSGDFRLVVLDANLPVILNDTEESAYNSLKQLDINIWKNQNRNVLLTGASEAHIDVQLAKEVGVSEVDLPASCMTELADMWPTGQPAPGLRPTSPFVEFLKSMHHKSLQVTELKNKPQVRDRCERLLEALPDDAIEKFQITAGSTAKEKIQTIIGLVNEHRGEICRGRQKA